MSELLYYEDSYIKKFEAKVTSVDSSPESVKITLDRTAFYPGGGGQPNDEGWMTLHDRRLRILKVDRNGHWLEPEEGVSFAVGQTAGFELDWDRRFTLMRTHTALHVLSGVVWRDYGASVTGGSMDLAKGRLDFEFEKMNKDLVQEIEGKCNEEVKAAREVRTQFLPRDEAMKIPDLIRTKVNLIPESVKKIRTVEIVGLDLQADGGTHVANTQEVGEIRVVDYKSKGAINKRIYIEIL
ncbi:MAG: alanyl-tRNA editing protein [Candidatus Thorarchaeota archaeon]